MRRRAGILTTSIKQFFSKFYNTYKNSAYLQYIKLYKVYIKRRDIFIRFELHSTYTAVCKDLFWFKSRFSYYLHNWIYTTNHKRIAINYFIFVIFSGITGLVLATIIRLELAYPGVGVLAGDSIQYLTIITLHGIVMVFFMIMPLLLGAFGNFLLPTQLGVHDVAFPRLNSASFWFLPSGLIMLCQLLCTDRRYHRLNCFNFREVQSLLKKKYFFNLMMSNESHQLHDQTLAALRLRAQSGVSLSSSKKANLDYGLNLANKKRLFYFDSLYSYRFSVTLSTEPFISIHNPTLYSHFGKIRQFVNKEFSEILNYTISNIKLDTITSICEIICNVDVENISFFYNYVHEIDSKSIYTSLKFLCFNAPEFFEFLISDMNIIKYRRGAYNILDYDTYGLICGCPPAVLLNAEYLWTFFCSFFVSFSYIKNFVGQLIADINCWDAIFSFFKLLMHSMYEYFFFIDEKIDEIVLILFNFIVQKFYTYEVLDFLCEPRVTPILRALLSTLIPRETLIFDTAVVCIRGTGISYDLRAYVNMTDKFWDIMYMYVLILHLYDLKTVLYVISIDLTILSNIIFCIFEPCYCFWNRNAYYYTLATFVHCYHVCWIIIVTVIDCFDFFREFSAIALEYQRATRYYIYLYYTTISYLENSLPAEIMYLCATNYLILVNYLSFKTHLNFCKNVIMLYDWCAYKDMFLLTFWIGSTSTFSDPFSVTNINETYYKIKSKIEPISDTILNCFDDSLWEFYSLFFKMGSHFDEHWNEYRLLLADPYLILGVAGTITINDLNRLFQLIDDIVRTFVNNLHVFFYLFSTEMAGCFEYLNFKSEYTRFTHSMLDEISLITTIRYIFQVLKVDAKETYPCCLLSTKALLIDNYYLKHALLQLGVGIINTDFIWNIDVLLLMLNYRTFEDLCFQRRYNFINNIFYFVNSFLTSLYNIYISVLKINFYDRPSFASFFMLQYIYLNSFKYYTNLVATPDEALVRKVNAFFYVINCSWPMVTNWNSLILLYSLISQIYVGTGRAHILAFRDFYYDMRFKEQTFVNSPRLQYFYYYLRLQIDSITLSTSFLSQDLIAHEIGKKANFWISRALYRFYVYARYNAPISVPDITQTLVNQTALFVDETFKYDFTENFIDVRYHKSDKPRFKYDDKSGNMFPELKQHLITQLLPSYTYMTRGIARPFWIFSSEFMEKFANFYATLDKTIYTNFLQHAFIRSNSNRYSHERYYDQIHFGLNFWDIHFVSINALRLDNFVINSHWLGPVEIIRKFHKLFIEQAFQYRMLSNWRHLKFHREAWRCRSLLGRNQKSSFRRNLHENAVFWVLERNSRDILPGWAFVTPFSSRTRYTAVGKVDVALMAVFLAGLGSLISSANFLLTYRYLSTLSNKKMRDARSFYSEALMVSSGMILGANPLLLIAILLLLSDRHWKTSFFDYSGGGDTVLFQHMFWFFGHPEVYIIIMPCFGFTNTILSYYLRKRISARASLVYSMYTISFLGFFVWGHHMYMVGLSHQTRMLYSTLTVMISVPAATKIMHWLVTIVNSTIHFELPLLFTFTFIFLFVSGGISGMFVAHTGMDILFHDTFYVIGHFHIMFSGAAMFSAFSAFYFYFPALFGVKYSRIFAYMHFIYYLVGQLMTLIPMFWLGYAGMPRRVLDYPTAFGGWHSISSAGHLVTVAAILAFFFMLIDSIRQSKPAIRTTFGVGRYNTRLNFYYYEIHRLAYLRSKTSLLNRKPLNQSLRHKGTLYANYEHLESTVFKYEFEPIDAKEIITHNDK